MLRGSQPARINVKLLVILIVVTTAVGISLVAARQIRRSILSKMSLEAGEAAFAKGDWPAAYRNLQEYLGRNPDDVEILKKYARARLSVRPLDSANITGAIAAYRRVLQLTPLDESAYEQLAVLYTGAGDFANLAYIARLRRDRAANDPNARKAPNDWKASLWLADALVGLKKPQEAQQTLKKLLGELEPLADKHGEYVKACVRMYQLTTGESAEAKAEALDWLNRALAYYDPNAVTDPNSVKDPHSVEALVYRAQFYRQTKDIPGVDEDKRPSLARDYLATADRVGADDPQVRYILGLEWLALQDPERAAAELQAIDILPQETIEKSFFDMAGWKVARFRLASELALGRKAITEARSLADETLASLTEKRRRAQVLPSAIQIYVTVGAVAETGNEKAEAVQKARKCLDEYLDIVRGQQLRSASPLELAWLKASVEAAENKPYAVIDTLQPVAVSSTANPEMWRIWLLLSDAYRRTNQAARAANALQQCLQIAQRLGVGPRDPQVLQVLQELAKQYALMRDWKKAFETAQIAESAGATDLATRLCRIKAGIHLAVGPEGKMDATRVRDLSGELDGLRQVQPKDVDIRVLQALIAGALQQPQEVEKQLKLAIEECNEPLKAEVQFVRYYFAVRRRPEALALCEAACKRHPGIAEPWLILSEIHVADANDQAARRSLEQGIEAVADLHEKRVLSRKLAWLDITHGDRAAGIQRLKDLAAQDANDLQVRSLLLGLREIRQDAAGAQTLVDELRRAEGESGLSWRLYQAELWLSSDTWVSRQRDIADLLRYCMEANPQGSAPALLLAGMYERLGDLRRAEDVYREALARNPSATGVANGLLTLLGKQERFADAEKVLQQARMVPELTNAWQIEMAVGTGDYAKAIDELRRLVSRDDQDADSRVALAQLIYQQKKDSRQALQYLEEAEALASNAQVLASAVRAKVSILKAEGQAEEARRVLDEYVAQRNDFTAYWMRAAFLKGEGQLEQAEADYRKLTTFGPEGAFGYRELANFYGDTQRLDKAVVALEEGIKAYPADRTLALKLMLCQAQQSLAIANSTPESEKETREKLKREAREKLEEIIRQEPAAASPYFVLINQAMQDGQYQTARDYAVRALGSNAGNPALLSARARAELALGNDRAAGEAARLALQRDPNDPNMVNLFARAALASGDRGLLGEVRPLVESAVGREPASGNLLLLRTEILVALERWEELKGISSAYVSANVQDPAVLLQAASILAASNSAELKKEGLQLFEQAVRLSPASVEARLGLATTLYQTGEVERAEKIYREVLEQHPDSIRALNDLAWVLQEHDRRYEDALVLADKGLKIAPDDRNLLDTRGTILINLPDRLGDAKNDFARLADLLPDRTPQKAKNFLRLGRLCAQLNDPAGAKQYLQAALDIDRQIQVFTEAQRAEIEKIVP